VAAKKNSTDTQVTRIKASTTTSSKSKTKTPAAKKPTGQSKPTTTKREKEAKVNFNPITAIFGYFKGAWEELRQVHWPTRKATWGLTVAVLLFSAFFVVVVLLLDAFFKYLFELVLG